MKEPNGDPMMVVTIVTTDPMYLRQPFVISSQFKKAGERCRVEAHGVLGQMVGKDKEGDRI